jgi:hypothetical protein
LGWGGAVQSAFTACPVPLRMTMRAPHLAVVLVVTAGLAVGTSLVIAQSNPRVPQETDQDRPIMLANVVSMNQAVKMAEQKFKARVVRAEAQHDGDGHTVYVLRMLNESGRVWTVRVDASNGTVL